MSNRENQREQDGRRTSQGVNDQMPSQDTALADQCRTYIIDDAVYVVYDDRLWRRTGQTHNPREIALADAVGWEGELLTVHPAGATVELQHRHAGILQRLVASVRTDWCYVTFEEVDSLEW